MRSGADPALLSSAIVIWTGWGETPWPARDETRLVERYGAGAAATLLPRIRELEDEFYASDARFIAADLKQMADLAEARFRELHPELSEEAIRALSWCYTYDYK